jgi:hypothetical protein
MNTVLNLLSAAAVVVTGAITSAPSALSVPSTQVLPTTIERLAGTQSTHTRAKALDSQWLILGEERKRASENAQTLSTVPTAPTQRWVF